MSNNPTPPQSEREKLETWWLETNGTGMAACLVCTPSRICAWHRDRLDELADFIIQEKASARKQVTNAIEANITYLQKQLEKDLYQVIAERYIESIYWLKQSLEDSAALTPKTTTSDSKFKMLACEMNHHKNCPWPAVTCGCECHVTTKEQA